MPEKDKIQSLYDYFSPNYNMGTPEEFRIKMHDPVKRKSFYDGLSNEYNLGKDINDFESKIAPALSPMEPANQVAIEQRIKQHIAQNVENNFQQWYKGMAEQTGLNPNPDDPQQKYDYRAAFMEGAKPEQDQNGQFHWPSKYKAPDHPNRFVVDQKEGLIDTISGDKVTPEQVKSESKRLKASYDLPIPEAYQYLMNDFDDNKGTELLKSFVNKLGAGSSWMGAAISRVPALIYNIAALPGNAIFSALGKDEMQNKAPKWLIDNPVADYFDKQAELFRNNSVRYTDSIWGALKSGNYGDAVEQMVLEVGEAVPLQIVLMGAGFAAKPALTVLGGMGTVSSAAKMKENENVEVPEFLKTMNALASGMAESSSEMLGTINLVRIGRGLVEKYGTETAQQLLKKSFSNSIQNTIGKFYPVAAPIVEGVEELSNQVAQNIIDKSTGVNPNVGLFDGAMDAFLVGTATAGATFTPGYAVGVMGKEKVQKKGEQNAENVRGDQEKPVSGGEEYAGSEADRGRNIQQAPETGAGAGNEVVGETLKQRPPETPSQREGQKEVVKTESVAKAVEKAKGKEGRIKSIVKRYEDTGEIKTINDFVDEISVLDDVRFKNEINAFRKAQEESLNLGNRMDLEGDAGESLLAKVKSVIGKDQEILTPMPKEQVFDLKNVPKEKLLNRLTISKNDAELNAIQKELKSRIEQPIPEVYMKMPMGELRKSAEYGIDGAKRALKQRTMEVEQPKEPESILKSTPEELKALQEQMKNEANLPPGEVVEPLSTKTQPSAKETENKPAEPEYSVINNRQDLESQLSKVLELEKVKEVMAFQDAKVKTEIKRNPDLTEDKIYSEMFAGLDMKSTPEEVAQRANAVLSPTAKKGAVSFLTDGRAIIHAFKNFDASSAVHELFHVWRNRLPTNDQRILLKAVKEKSWTKKAEEGAAKLWENYVATGKAPTPELKRVFEKFKVWMKEIYGVIKGSPIDVNLSKPVKGVFARMLGAEPEVIEVKQKIKKPTQNLRRYIKDRFGGLNLQDRKDYGIRDEKGLNLQIAGKEGEATSLDNIVATLMGDEILLANSPEEGTRILLDALRANKKVSEIGNNPLEDIEDVLAQKELQYWYDEARNEKAIPNEMSLEEFAKLQDEMKGKVQGEVGGIVSNELLFQEEKPNKYEKEFIKEKAKQGIDIKKIQSIQTKLENREKLATLLEEEKKKTGQLDVFAEKEKKQQTILFQEENETTDNGQADIIESTKETGGVKGFIKEGFGTTKEQIIEWIGNVKRGEKVFNFMRRGDSDKNVMYQAIKEDTRRRFRNVSKEEKAQITNTLLGIQGINTMNGEIVFGALQRAGVVTEEFAEGFKPGDLMNDGRMVGDVIDIDGKKLVQTYRVITPDKARTAYNGLNDKSKNIVKEYLNPIEQSKEVDLNLKLPAFSREVLRNQFNIQTEMAEEMVSYVPSISSDPKIFPTLRRAFRTFIPALSRKLSPHRLYQTGILREKGKEEKDFSRITQKMRSSLAVEDIHNRMVGQVIATALEPINKQNPIKPGHIAFNLGYFKDATTQNRIIGIIDRIGPILTDHGIDATDLKASIYQAGGGKYQISEKLLDYMSTHFKQNETGILSAIDNIAGAGIRAITGYWLVGPSTINRNVLTNKLFLSIKTINDFWEGALKTISFAKDVAPFSNFTSDLFALIPRVVNPAKRFTPKEVIPNERLGQSFLSEYNEEESNWSLKKWFFRLWNATEFCDKRMIYWAEYRAQAIREMKRIQQGLKQEHGLPNNVVDMARNNDESGFIDAFIKNAPDAVETKAYDEMDRFIFDYNNIPNVLKKIKRSAIGRGVLPYPIFFYKLFRQQIDLFNPMNPINALKAAKSGDMDKFASNFAKTLTAATVYFTISSLLSGDDDDERIEGKNVPYYIDTFGRVKVSDNPDLWVRLYDIPYIGDIMAGKAIYGNNKDFTDYFTERISLGPLFEGVAILTGKGDKYDLTYQGNMKPLGSRLGSFTSGTMPYSRVLNYIKNVYDPVKRIDYDEYKNFLANLWLGFASNIPFISKTIPPKLGSKGEEISTEWQQEFAKFWLLNTKNPDVEDYNKALSYLLYKYKEVLREGKMRGAKEQATGYDYDVKAIEEEMKNIEELADKIDRQIKKLSKPKENKITQ